MAILRTYGYVASAETRSVGALMGIRIGTGFLPFAFMV